VTRSQKIEVGVFNAAGQLSKMLVNGELEAGSYSVVWDGNSNSGAALPKGIYFLQIAGAKDKVVKKIIKN
jgi:flagellar hook assembly protein FlgD